MQLQVQIPLVRHKPNVALLLDTVVPNEEKVKQRKVLQCFERITRPTLETTEKN